MGKSIQVKATEKEIRLMETLLSEGHIAFKYAVRIQTVLNRFKGRTTHEIADILGINNNTVSDHVRRFNQGGLEALLRDKTRLPGKDPVSEGVKDELTRLVCQEKPVDATHWSTRELGKKFKISHTTVSKILKERGLKPHIVKRFQLSTDKGFKEKLKDVAGLYLEPPENSIVFCVDEKTQIQALERTQPILPMRPGIPERQPHDYERHGTTVLFAALNVASGRVIGNCKSRHTSLDYVEFLKLLDKKTPKGKTLHIIADNVSSHKAPQVKEYLKSKEGRFAEHFIPTYSSWLNLIERWFAEITNKRIRRESWSSLKELETAIIDYITSWNKSGHKFVWTKNVKQIEKSIKKAKLN
jgi:transposase